MEQTTAGTHMEQEAYLRLEHSCTGDEVLSEAAAKLLINKEFGFEASRIEIVTEVVTFEVVDHHLKAKAEYTRKPLNGSTDWNYVRFNVASWQYEMVNGQLYFYED